MRKLFKKIRIAFVCMMLTASAAAVAEDIHEPVFECTPEETARYIEGTTSHLSLPTNIPTEKDFNQAYLETMKEICEKDPGAEGCLDYCLHMPDFKLDEKWQQLVDAYEKLKNSVSMTSINGSLLTALREAFDKAIEKIMEKLRKGVCQAVDYDKLKGRVSKIANEKIKDKYGLDMENFDESAMDLIKDELKDTYGDDIDYLYDPSSFEDEKKEEADDRVRALDDDFWAGI